MNCPPARGHSGCRVPQIQRQLLRAMLTRSPRQTLAGSPPADQMAPVIAEHNPRTRIYWLADARRRRPRRAQPRRTGHQSARLDRSAATKNPTTPWPPTSRLAHDIITVTTRRIRPTTRTEDMLDWFWRHNAWRGVFNNPLPRRRTTTPGSTPPHCPPRNSMTATSSTTPAAPCPCALAAAALGAVAAAASTSGAIAPAIVFALVACALTAGLHRPAAPNPFLEQNTASVQSRWALSRQLPSHPAGRRYAQGRHRVSRLGIPASPRRPRHWRHHRLRRQPGHVEPRTGLRAQRPRQRQHQRPVPPTQRRPQRQRRTVRHRPANSPNTTANSKPTSTSGHWNPPSSSPSEPQTKPRWTYSVKRLREALTGSGQIAIRHYRGAQTRLWAAFNPAAPTHKTGVDQFAQPTTTKKWSRFVPFISTMVGNSTGILLGFNTNSILSKRRPARPARRCAPKPQPLPGTQRRPGLRQILCRQTYRARRNSARDTSIHRRPRHRMGKRPGRRTATKPSSTWPETSTAATLYAPSRTRPPAATGWTTWFP